MHLQSAIISPCEAAGGQVEVYSESIYQALRTKDGAASAVRATEGSTLSLTKWFRSGPGGKRTDHIAWLPSICLTLILLRTIGVVTEF
jgi:hypothetical protein